MTVVTISRQFGSGGDEIALQICEILGYRQFDKRMIEQSASEAGLSEAEIVDYSEENHKVRGFLERLFKLQPALTQARFWMEDPQTVETIVKPPLEDDMALSLVQNAIYSAHKAGNLVIVGRGGQVILRDYPNTLHVRIEAPMEDRVQRIRDKIRQARHPEETDLELRRQAHEWIVERDAASADYIRAYYHVDWSDSSLYHLILNTGRLSIEEGAKVIACTANLV